MIAGAFLLALLLSAPAAYTNVAEGRPPPSRLLQFIGEQVSFEPIDCILYRWQIEDMDGYSEDGGAESAECNEDDLHYRARYRVLLSLDGEPGEIVEFFATGWTSHYAESRHALLYVLESPDGTLLPSGLAISVYPTVDDDWASCDSGADSEPLEIAGDLVFGRTDGMSSHGIAQRYPSSDYAIVGQEAFCLRGRRLSALVEELDRDLVSLQNEHFPSLPTKTTPVARP